MVDVGGAMASIPWGGMIVKIFYWLGYALFALVVFGGVAAAWFLMSYKYKAQIFEKRGGGSTVVHSVGKIKNDKIKEFKDKGVTKWKFLWSRDVIDPKGYDCIYPGNRIFLYKTAPKTYHPVKLNVSNPSADFAPVPADVGFWMNLEMRQAAQDYNKPGFMDKYGTMMVMTGTVMFCLILVGVTVYYTYQHANGVTGALQGLTGAVKNVNTIPGVTPFG